MAFILATLFLDILGIGLVIPVLPELVTGFVGGDPTVAAFYYGPIAAVYAVMQFVFAPVLGSLSDRFGRRPVILLSLFGFGVNYLVLALAPTLLWLVVGRALAGVTGATITAGNAYIADISTDKNRAQNFGLVGAAFGLGFILGPAFGGILGALDPRLPFWAAAGLVFVNLLYGYFILPESLASESRRPFSWRRANPLASMLYLRAYPLVLGLAAATVLLSLAQRGLETVWVLYTNYSFGWLALENGLSLAAVGFSTALVQGGLVRVLIPRFGERRAIVLALVCSLAAYTLFGLATEGWMMYLVIVVFALGALAGPAIQSLVTGTVRADEQGRVQGSISSLVSLSSVVAPLMSTGLFGYFTSERAPVLLPGAPFYLSAVFVALALLLVFRLFGNAAPRGRMRREPAEGRGAR
ncbi:TCR/Tet family MFS transporter [soil metagenome]